MKNITVKKISWETIRNYWIEVKHFDKGKKYTEYIWKLGPHRAVTQTPKSLFYGLYDINKLIGVAGLTQWNNELIRYRTINIRKEYRGSDLGWYLIQQALKMDNWNLENRLFGWIKRDHLQWAKTREFITKGDWYDNHIMAVRKINEL